MRHSRHPAAALHSPQERGYLAPIRANPNLRGSDTPEVIERAMNSEVAHSSEVGILRIAFETCLFGSRQIPVPTGGDESGKGQVRSLSRAVKDWPACEIRCLGITVRRHNRTAWKSPKEMATAALLLVSRFVRSVKMTDAGIGKTGHRSVAHTEVSCSGRRRCPGGRVLCAQAMSGNPSQPAPWSVLVTPRLRLPAAPNAYCTRRTSSVPGRKSIRISATSDSTVSITVHIRLPAGAGMSRKWIWTPFS